MRDFKRLRQDPPQGVNGSPNPDNIMHWNAVIFGPEDTPWDGGRKQNTTISSGIYGVHHMQCFCAAVGVQGHACSLQLLLTAVLHYLVANQPG